VDYTLIIGEDEVNAGTVTVRRMADSHQETVSHADVAALVSGGEK
jgi:histidyl-tRNA synthetase